MVANPEQSMPGENDVVCGGSRIYHFHSGNKRFRKIVEEHLVQYVEASKSAKSEIITNIVAYIRKGSKTGGFIQRDPLSGSFVEVADHYAVSRLNYRCFLL